MEDRPFTSWLMYWSVVSRRMRCTDGVSLFGRTSVFPMHFTISADSRRMGGPLCMHVRACAGSREGSETVPLCACTRNDEMTRPFVRLHPGVSCFLCFPTPLPASLASLSPTAIPQYLIFCSRSLPIFANSSNLACAPNHHASRIPGTAHTAAVRV